MCADSDDNMDHNNAEETEDDVYARAGSGSSIVLHRIIDEFMMTRSDTLKTRGLCFRCSSAPAEVKEKKTTGLRLKKSFAFASCLHKEQCNYRPESRAVTCCEDGVTKRQAC